MLTIGEIQSILDDVDYPGYDFLAMRHLGFSREDDRFYIQATFITRCAVTGQSERQCTRKWYISREATKSEVVQTALKCVLTAVEHEARESFKYRCEAVFGPHFDVDALHALCERDALDRREAAPA